MVPCNASAGMQEVQRRGDICRGGSKGAKGSEVMCYYASHHKQAER